MPSLAILPPGVVRVLGQRLRTKIVKDAEALTVAKDDPADHDLSVGYADFHGGRILVARAQSDDQFADTWLHELLHHLLYHIGHDDEELVGRLSPVLLDFMRRNPKAVAFLMQRYWL